MPEPQNLLDVQPVFTSAAVLRDFVDKHSDFGGFIPLSKRSSKGTGTFLKGFVQ
jgi:hypothetical protein